MKITNVHYLQDEGAEGRNLDFQKMLLFTDIKIFNKMSLGSAENLVKKISGVDIP